MTIVTLIAAMGRDRIIGAKGGMPWKLPREMRHFVRSTRGKPIVVGRTTFASWGGRALPHRTNIVLTRNPDYQAPEGVHVCGGLDEALDLVRDDAEVMICGGAVVYRASLPRAQKMILTHIDATFDGDTRFPDWDPEVWLVEREETFPADEDNTFAYTIRWYVRKLTPQASTELA